MKNKQGMVLACAASIILSGCTVKETIPNPPQSGSSNSQSSSSGSQSSSSGSQSSSSGSQSSSSSSQPSSSSSQSSSSGSQSSSSSSQSSSSGSQSSSSSSQSSSSSSQSSSSSKPQSSSSDTVLPHMEITEYIPFSGTISAGSELCVSEGQVLLINEKTVCENGGAIKIEKGGFIKLSGEIDLSGDLYVDGMLIIDENAKIGGTGTVHVKNSFNDISCSGSVTAKIKAPEPVEKNGVTYVGDILIVNKKYALPKSFGNGLSGDLSAAIKQMRKDSGYSMRIVSGFRDYATQNWIFNSYVSKYGVEESSTFSALPGHSEHQAGLAADITSCNNNYAYTDEAHWLAENCYKYGLIIRYPKDKVNITGYIYEPWHVRYVGKSNAKLIHDSGLCLEEFLQVEG